MMVSEYALRFVGKNTTIFRGSSFSVFVLLFANCMLRF